MFFLKNLENKEYGRTLGHPLVRITQVYTIEMLCKCCANLGIKKVNSLIIRLLTFALVGITGLEPATSRPPEERVERQGI